MNPVTDYINALFLTISPAHCIDIRHQAIVDAMSIQILADAFLHFALLKSTKIAAVA